MRIVKLTAENYKKLRAIEITPKGDVVTITGKNAQGKTSILDAIWAALGGAKHIQAVPIRKGQDRARIRLDLGELVVERRFTDGKASTLSVESAQGARFTSPQGILDALLGALSFDPLAFVGQEPREQFETLRRIVNLEVDVDQLEALNRGDYERRTELNREAKTLRAQAAGIPAPAQGSAQLIDTAALVARLADASKVNADVVSQRAARGRRQDEIAQLRAGARAQVDRAAELRAQADQLESEASAAEASADVQERQLLDLPPIPAEVDVEVLGREIAEAQELNRAFELRARRSSLEGQAAALEGQAQELTEAMDARAKVKADAIAAAKMPVEGLGLGDQVVLFGGMPFAQASSAEQLRVSVSIAMAANPKLRVIRIKEGSLLDADGLALIASMAAAEDYQLWIERVDDTGKMGFYVEDGQVVAVDGEPVVEQPKPELQAPKPAASSSPAAPAPAARRKSSPW